MSIWFHINRFQFFFIIILQRQSIRSTMNSKEQIQNINGSINSHGGLLDIEESEDKNSKSGVWTEDEREKYTIFLDFFSQEFRSKFRRRENKIFKIMSYLITTRDAVQCRSHHMKQIKTLKSVSTIIKKFKKKIGLSAYEKKYDQLINSEYFQEEIIENVSSISKKTKATLTKDVQVQVQISQPQALNGKMPINQTFNPLNSGFIDYKFPIFWPYYQPFQ